MKKTTKTTASPAPAPTPADGPPPEPKTTKAPRAPKPIKLVTPVSAPAATVITAKIDVGFGNTLSLRGEGPGLSWEKGVALENVGSGEWTLSLPGVLQPVIFKLLINDETWSAGENYTAAPGSGTTVKPTF